MGARETVLCVLMSCRRQASWTNAALKEYIARDGLDRRDAALATRLCFGVLQNRMKLDFYLKQLLTGRLKDLHPVVHDILHMGLYQLYEMDKIPVSAAVNESVMLARKYCKKQKFAAGLVNGVLRNAVRTKGTLNEPVTLSERYSHPQSLIDLLRESVGDDHIETLLIANNKAPETVIQTHTGKITTQELREELEAESVIVQPHEWLQDCLVLSGTGNIEHLRAFQEGKFYVQDAAARLSVLCAQVQGASRVLDCCAAPGGKSFASAIDMGGIGAICSCDIHPHKIQLIQKGADRLGLSNITVHLQDAQVFRPEWESHMDVVLADVPCSGYGIIRKKPDIRYKDPVDTIDLPALQLRILNTQARYVRPGGVLIYSTCTILRRENEDVVHAFLEQNQDYILEPLSLPDIFPVNTTGMLTLVPGEYDTDGFFISRLRRKT